MNKLITKIVGAALGAAMTVGVGVAVAVNANKVVEPAYASDISTIDFSQSGNQVYDTEKTLTHAKWKIVKNNASTNPTYNNGYRFYGKSYFYVIADNDYRITSITVEYAKNSSPTLKAWKGDAIVTNFSTTTGQIDVPTSKTATSIGAKVFEIANTGTSGNIALKNVSVTIDAISTDPSVSISNNGSSNRMLNKNGDPLTIGSISASTEYLGNTPYFVWSITNNNDCDAALSDDANLHTSTPTITASHTGNFDLSVTAYNEQGGSQSATVGNTMSGRTIPHMQVPCTSSLKNT